jgi:hypothetical protein
LVPGGLICDPTRRYHRRVGAHALQVRWRGPEPWPGNVVTRLSPHSDQGLTTALRKEVAAAVARTVLWLRAAVARTNRRGAHSATRTGRSSTQLASSDDGCALERVRV